MPKKKRPLKKPYPSFPLTPHPTGQWCKKIHGKLFYFGRDADAALSKYLKESDDLQAGRKPRQQSNDLTIKELANRFLTAKRSAVDARELTEQTWRDYHLAMLTLTEHFGKDRAVADLRPSDFEALRAKLAKTRGPVGNGQLHPPRPHRLSLGPRERTPR